MPTSLILLTLLSAQIQYLSLPDQHSRAITIYDAPPSAVFQEMTPDGQLGDVQMIR